MHIPVLQKEVLQYLSPEPNENFIDATISDGGHALSIIDKTQPNGKLLGIDWDKEIIKNLKLKIKNFEKRIVLVSDNFANLEEIVKHTKFSSVQGILFDLGMSSWHLEESGRGFSFLKNEPLDMRYNSQNSLTGLTAERILNYYSFLEIEKILRTYGEERFAKKIAERIIERRKIKPIESTFQLVEIIKNATPLWYHHRRIHLATKTFQALRIAVNDELNNLERALPQAVEILKLGGRLAVISFHSLEDRIVKNFYRSRTSMDLKILTKKPVRPAEEEIKINPRARSAKLRAAQKYAP